MEGWDELSWSARTSLITGRVQVLSFHAGCFPQERALSNMVSAMEGCDGILVKVCVRKAGSVHVIAMGDFGLDYPIESEGGDDDEA